MDCSKYKIENMKIKSYNQLCEFTKYESQLYSKYMFANSRRRFMAWLKEEPTYEIMKWQMISRKADYYKYRIKNKPSILEMFKYLYYIKCRNHISKKLGIEIGTENIDKGLIVYHYAGGLVVNGNSVIGTNCHLHGNNCIGNAGPHDLRCPIIGNNVMLGVGAKVIGNVRIANNVKIAAGAVVVKNIAEEGCTVAGVPAQIIKHANHENS